ncbi:hypothetical protein Tcan_17322, partial [Toxocara canis]
FIPTILNKETFCVKSIILFTYVICHYSVAYTGGQETRFSRFARRKEIAFYEICDFSKNKLESPELKTDRRWFTVKTTFDRSGRQIVNQRKKSQQANHYRIYRANVFQRSERKNGTLLIMSTASSWRNHCDEPVCRFRLINEYDIRLLEHSDRQLHHPLLQDICDLIGYAESDSVLSETIVRCVAVETVCVFSLQNASVSIFIKSKPA